MTRKHATPQVEIAQDKIVQIPSHFIDTAVVNKLSGTEWALWMYLCRVCPFGDLSKGGEKVFKSLPSPAQLAIILGRSEKQIARAAKTIEDLGLYSFRIDSWRGYNETAVAAKAVLEKLEREKRNNATRTKMSQPGQKSPETDKNVHKETRMSEPGQKSLAEGSETSPATGLPISHTIQTSSNYEKTTTDTGNAAVSFSGMNDGESIELREVGSPGQLSRSVQDSAVPNLCINQTSVPIEGAEQDRLLRQKSSAPPHVTLTQHDLLISGFADWLTQKGYEEYRKDLVGLSSVMKGADEKVLSNAIEHVKERIDTILKFGGYLRRAIENQLKPQQVTSPPQATQVPSQAVEPLDKTGFPVMNSDQIESCLPRATGYCKECDDDARLQGKVLRDRGLTLPEYYRADVWGMVGQLAPIRKYYESQGIDFEPIKPHLAGEYLIYESDKLPVVCFCDPHTRDYQLVVISRY